MLHRTLVRKTGTIITAFALVLSVFAVFPFGTPHAVAQTSDCGFTRDLTVGVDGEDVRCLQRYLNANGFQIAASGAGAPGSETSLFRAGTAAAVAKWQAANGISGTGTFGPVSRTKYRALVAGGTSAPSTPSSVNISGATTARQAIVDAISRIVNAADDIDDSTAQKHLDDAHHNILNAFTAFLNANFTTATSLARSAQADATEAIDRNEDRNDDTDEDDAQEAVDDLQEAISDAQDEIDEAEDDGDDVDDANDILDEARDSLDDAEEALDDEDWDEAMDFTDEGQDKVDEALDEIGSSSSSDADEDDADDALSDAEDAIDEARDAIDEAQDDGDDTDDAEDLLDEAEDALSDAEDAFDDEDWDEVVDLANEAEELANDAIDEL
jgi:peptidoglycan hydrolase-like protein with peptidoglycan-binding domain